MEGLAIPAAVAIEEVGPAPPIPAHVVQLAHGFILCICVLVTWADAEAVIAMAIAINATTN
jgi:hypothetical protein